LSSSISELSSAFWLHHYKVTWVRVSWAEVKSQLSVRSWREWTCSEGEKRDRSAFLSHISVTVASGDIFYEWAVQCMCTYCWSDSAFFPPFFTSRYSTNTCNLAPVLFSVCYFVRVGTGFPKSCFTSSPVLPHVLVSLAILPWSSAPNPPNKQRRIGQGQETLTGQGQETFCQCKPCH